MRYSLCNRDRRAIAELPKPRCPVLSEKSFIACGGSYEQFGMPVGKLETGHALLMYESTVGVLAVGEILKRCGHVPREKSRYYWLAGLTGGAFENRIPVDWHTDL